MSIKRVVLWLKSHTLVVLCVPVSLILIVVLVLRGQEVSAINAQLQDAQDRIDKINRNTRYSATIDADMKRMSAYLTQVEKSLIDPAAKALNLAYFYDAGVRCGVDMILVEQKALASQLEDSKAKVKATPEFELFSAVQFDLQFTGDFPSTLRFIDTIRREHPMSRIEKMTIGRNTGDLARIETTSLTISILTELPSKK